MFKSLLMMVIACLGTLSAQTKVFVFSGSTREDSFNKKLANEAAEMAKKFGAVVTVIDL